MTNGEKVKLAVYRHEDRETIIEFFQAKTWDDFKFAVLKHDGGRAFPAEVDFTAIKDQLGVEHLIIVPNDLEIEFYGIREADDS